MSEVYRGARVTKSKTDSPNTIASRKRRQKNALEQARYARECRVLALAPADAIALYRTEKAKSDERNAAKRAQTMTQIKAALQRADDERTVQQRGGRRKMASKDFTSDKANALVNALASWHE